MGGFGLRVYLHPGFNFTETVGEVGDCSRGDGGSGNVKLDLIVIAVKAESMTAYDVAEGKQVKDRTLGDALGQRGR